MTIMHFKSVLAWWQFCGKLTGSYSSQATGKKSTWRQRYLLKRWLSEDFDDQWLASMKGESFPVKNVYQVIDNTVLLVTTHNALPYGALIDIEDLDRVKQYEGEWKISQDQRFFMNPEGDDQKTIYLHSVIMDAFLPGQRVQGITHRNGIAADNRKSNLMVAGEV